MPTMFRCVYIWAWGHQHFRLAVPLHVHWTVNSANSQLTVTYSLLPDYGLYSYLITAGILPHLACVLYRSAVHLFSAVIVCQGLLLQRGCMLKGCVRTMTGAD